MPISPYREHKIMLLAKMNLGIASEDLEEINLYNYYKNYYTKNKKSEKNHWRINKLYFKSY